MWQDDAGYIWSRLTLGEETVHEVHDLRHLSFKMSSGSRKWAIIKKLHGNCNSANCISAAVCPSYSPALQNLHWESSAGSQPHWTQHRLGSPPLIPQRVMSHVKKQHLALLGSWLQHGATPRESVCGCSDKNWAPAPVSAEGTMPSIMGIWIQWRLRSLSLCCRLGLL